MCSLILFDLYYSNLLSLIKNYRLMHNILLVVKDTAEAEAFIPFMAEVYPINTLPLITLINLP